MGEQTNYTIKGVSCDATGCDAEVTGYEEPLPSGLRYYEQLASDAGWTIYVGRTRRYYCAAHKPRTGHQMRLIIGEETP